MFSARLIVFMFLLGFPASLAAQQPDTTQVIIATDISRSMQHTDPNARDRIRGQEVLIRNLSFDENLKAGVLLFTDQVERQSDIQRLPMAQDRKNRLDRFIREFDPSRNQSGSGTNLVLALRKSIEMFDSAPPCARRIVLLMSDGDYDRAETLLSEWSAEQKVGGALVREISRMVDQGIMLYCVPITPRVYEVQGNQDQVRKWEAGHELLAKMAVATGGRSFERVPGVLEFADIYDTVRQQWSPGLIGVEKNEVLQPEVLPIDETVIIEGRGLRKIRLPGPAGHVIKLPRSDETLDDYLSPVNFQWRPQGDDWGVITLYQPQDLKRWVGRWQIEVESGSEGTVRVKKRGGLEVVWKHPPYQKVWQDERVRLQFSVDTRKPENRAAILASLRCTAWLLSNDQPVQRIAFTRLRPESSSPSGSTVFDASFPLPTKENLKLLLELAIDSPESEPKTCYRLQQDLQVSPGAPVGIVGISGEQEIFSPGEDQTRPMRWDGVLRLRGIAIPGNSDWTVRSIVPPPEASDDFKAENDGDNSVLMGRVPLAQPNAKHGELPRFSVEAEAKNGRTGVFNVPPRTVPVEDGAAPSRALLAGGLDNSKTLFVSEWGAFWTFRIRFENVPENVIRSSGTIPMELRHQDPQSPRRLTSAKLITVNGIRGESSTWDATYQMDLHPDQLSQPGNVDYRVAGSIVSQTVDGTHSFQVAPSPIAVSVQTRSQTRPTSTASGTRSPVTLPAHEQLRGTVEAFHPYAIDGDGAVQLYLRNPNGLMRSIGPTVPLRMKTRGEAEFVVPPLTPSQELLQVVAKLKLGESETGDQRSVGFLSSSTYRVAERPLTVVIEVNADRRMKLKANQTFGVQWKAQIRGGSASQRQDLALRLQQYVEMASIRELLKITQDDNSIEPEESQDSNRIAEVSGDFRFGSVEISKRLDLRFRHPGNAIISGRLPAAEASVEMISSRLQLMIGPSDYYLHVKQPDVSEASSLIDTRKPGRSLGDPRLLTLVAGAPVEVSVYPRINHSMIGDLQGLFFAGSSYPVDLEVENDPTPHLRTTFEPTIHKNRLLCQLNDADGNELAVFGPFFLTARQENWRVGLVEGTLPSKLPANILDFPALLAIRAECGDPLPSASAPRTLHLRLQVTRTGSRSQKSVYEYFGQESQSSPGTLEVLSWQPVADQIMLEPGDHVRPEVLVKLGSAIVSQQEFPPVQVVASPFDLLIEGPEGTILTENDSQPAGFSYRVRRRDATLEELGIRDPVTLNFRIRNAANEVLHNQPKVEAQAVNDFAFKYEQPGEYQRQLQADLRAQTQDGSTVAYSIGLIGPKLRIGTPPPNYWKWGASFALVGLVSGLVLLLRERWRWIHNYPTPRSAVGLTVTPSQNVAVNEMPLSDAWELLHVTTPPWRKNLVRLRWIVCPPQTNCYRVAWVPSASEVSPMMLEFATAKDGAVLVRQFALGDGGRLNMEWDQSDSYPPQAMRPSEGEWQCLPPKMQRGERVIHFEHISMAGDVRRGSAVVHYGPLSEPDGPESKPKHPHRGDDNLKPDDQAFSVDDEADLVSTLTE